MRSAKWPLIKRLVDVVKIEAELAWLQAERDGIGGTTVEERVRQAVATAVLEDDLFWNEARGNFNWPDSRGRRRRVRYTDSGRDWRSAARSGSTST